MTGSADLLAHLPWAHRTPPLARLRRALAAVVILGAVGLVAASGAMPSAATADRSSPLAQPGATAPEEGGRRPVPSVVVAALTTTGWELLELSLRPGEGTTAFLSARLAAPTGRPADVQGLLDSLAHPQLRRATVDALVATATGTAVTLAARIDVADGPVAGDVVTGATLPGAIATVVSRAGGRVDGVRVIPSPDPDAPPTVAVGFSAAQDRVVNVLRVLEEGPSSPLRLRSILLRAVGSDLDVELILTPREPLPWT